MRYSGKEKKVLQLLQQDILKFLLQPRQVSFSFISLFEMIQNQRKKSKMSPNQGSLTEGENSLQLTTVY